MINASLLTERIINKHVDNRRNTVHACSEKRICLKNLKHYIDMQLQ